MKRVKSQELDKGTTSQQRKKTANVNKTSGILNLTPVCTIAYSGELNSSFCLQVIDEYALLQSKTSFGVMKFGKSSGNQQNKLQLSSTKFAVSNYTAAEGLKVNEKRVFMTSTHQEINEMMLNPILFPRCVQKNFQLAKSQLSPYSLNLMPIIASLSYHGSLELSNYLDNEDSNEITLETVAELCEIRKTSFILPSSYGKLGKVKEILDELTFSNFDWCPNIICSNRLIAAVSKSNEIIFYAIGIENEVSVLHCEKFDGVISCVKWIVNHNDHMLLVADSKGNIYPMVLQIAEDSKSLSLTKKDEIEGKLKIPISHIIIERIKETLLIICSKAHSLEIFHVHNNVVKSLTKYIGLSITGLVKIKNLGLEYLITTLNNKVYYMKLLATNDKIEIASHEKVDNEINPEMQASKYSAYGLAASRNKVLIFIALYPQTSNDHLLMKQPITISINMLKSMNDPYQLLIDNPSRKLTNYYDCVETVRYLGANKLDSLSALETKYDVLLSEEYLYHLKLQLIIIDSKMIYYQKRSNSYFDVLREQELAIKKIITVASAFSHLEKLKLRKGKLTDQSQLSMRCLLNFIKMCLNEEDVQKSLKSAQDAFQNKFQSLTKNFKISNSIKPEICLHCQEEISKESLICKSNHPVNRCVITKLQIPILMDNRCMNCNCCTMDLKTLQEITENVEQLCPYCDHALSFS